MINQAFKKITVFDNYEIIEYKPGYVQIKTIVNEDSLNPYGKAHGGYLFTLCDSLAGVVGYSLNTYCVTQQSNINYLKSVDLNTSLSIIGKCIHDGKKTKVVQVEIHSHELVATATFTMFVVNQV